MRHHLQCKLLLENIVTQVGHKELRRKGHKFSFKCHETYTTMGSVKQLKYTLRLINPFTVEDFDAKRTLCLAYRSSEYTTNLVCNRMLGSQFSRGVVHQSTMKFAACSSISMARKSFGTMRQRGNSQQPDKRRKFIAYHEVSLHATARGRSSTCRDAVVWHVRWIRVPRVGAVSYASRAATFPSCVRVSSFREKIGRENRKRKTCPAEAVRAKETAREKIENDQGPLFASASWLVGGGSKANPRLVAVASEGSAPLVPHHLRFEPLVISNHEVHVRRPNGTKLPSE